jgi:hypothetical protein
MSKAVCYFVLNSTAKILFAAAASPVSAAGKQYAFIRGINAENSIRMA